MPCHSMPTRRTPKSSWAWTLKLSSSESSTTFWRGRSSQARLGASSSRPAIDRLNGSFPSRPKVSFQRNSILRVPCTVVSGLLIVAPEGVRGLAVDLGRPQVAAGRRGERGAAPLHQRDGTAADVLARRAGPAEVIGQRDRGDQRGQLGTQGRLDLDHPRGVADLEGQPAGLDLRGHAELIHVVLAEPGGHRGLPIELGIGMRRVPDGFLGQLGGDGERLAVRDDHARGEVLQRGEGISGRAAPRREQPRPGAAGRRRVGQAQRDRGHDRHRGGHRPRQVARGGDGVAEVSPVRVLGHLADRRLAQRPRPGLLEVVADQFDDPQELVADRRVLPGQQHRELLEPSVPPDPSVDRRRDPQAADERRHEQRGAEPRRRVEGAVQEEHQQVGGHHREGRGAGRLHHLDHPDPAAEVVQLPPEVLRQLQPFVRIREAHTHLTVV